MTEGQPKFTDNEKILIASVSLDLARLGENFIWAVVKDKIRLATASFITGSKPLIVEIGDRKIEMAPDQVNHQISLMSEVIRQARAILQFQGKDELSIIDRRLRKAGQASVFDLDSEANKNDLL